MLTVAVALAAGLGAVCRYLVNRVVVRRAPLGTLVVNVLGSFLLGLVVGSDDSRVVAVAGAGFCGGFTTLSTLAWEALQLPRRQAWAYVVTSAVLGIAAAAGGLVMTGAL